MMNKTDKRRPLGMFIASMLIFGTMPAVFAEAPAETKEKGSIGKVFSSLFGLLFSSKPWHT